jgi:hypothetical protein
VHHAGEAESGEKEREREAQCEGVVDRADQQDGERDAEKQAQARRHDVHAAVNEDDGAVLGRPETPDPVGDARVALEQTGDHAVGPSYFQRPLHAESTCSG